jgi:hypothetical protein
MLNMMTNDDVYWHADLLQLLKAVTTQVLKKVACCILLSTTFAGTYLLPTLFHLLI